MRVLGGQNDNPTTLLGNRRGKPDLASFSLDLTWARADSGSAARSRDYPSPPMSGSPFLPAKGNQESAERGHGSYQATTHDSHREILATQGDAHPQRAGGVAGSLERSYVAESEARLSYGFAGPEVVTVRPPAYHQQGQAMHPQLSYLPPPGPGLGLGAAPSVYPVPVIASATTSRTPTEQQEGSLQSSPKLQRKTKGHVASACVPCKRAHLRQVSPQSRVSLQYDTKD